MGGPSRVSYATGAKKYGDNRIGLEKHCAVNGNMTVNEIIEGQERVFILLSNKRAETHNLFFLIWQNKTSGLRIRKRIIF